MLGIEKWTRIPGHPESLFGTLLPRPTDGNSLAFKVRRNKIVKRVTVSRTDDIDSSLLRCQFGLLSQRLIRSFTGLRM